MDKYDINLHRYMQQTKTPNKETQELIVKILVELFEKMHNDMNIVCYDLKLENIVLKIKDPNIEDIRLIDWDGNYCNNFHIKNIDKKLLVFMSVIIIANSFLHRYKTKINFFYDYYLKIKKKLMKMNMS